MLALILKFLVLLSIFNPIQRYQTFEICTKIPEKWINSGPWAKLGWFWPILFTSVQFSPDFNFGINISKQIKFTANIFSALSIFVYLSTVCCGAHFFVPFCKHPAFSLLACKQTLRIFFKEGTFYIGNRLQRLLMRTLHSTVCKSDTCNPRKIYMDTTVMKILKQNFSCTLLGPCYMRSCKKI